MLRLKPSPVLQFFTASCTNLSVLELFCAKPVVVDQIAQEAAV